MIILKYAFLKQHYQKKKFINYNRVHIRLSFFVIKVKDFGEVSNFCNDCTFYGHYNVEKIDGINLLRKQICDHS